MVSDWVAMESKKTILDSGYCFVAFTAVVLVRVKYTAVFFHYLFHYLFQVTHTVCVSQSSWLQSTENVWQSKAKREYVGRVMGPHRTKRRLKSGWENGWLLQVLPWLAADAAAKIKRQTQTDHLLLIGPRASHENLSLTSDSLLQESISQTAWTWDTACHWLGN